MFKSHYLYFLAHNLKTRLFHQKIPLLVGFKITHRCNLQCRGCPFWKMKTKSPTYAEVVSILDQLYKDGVRLIIFEGGEPFLWRDGNYRLENVIQYARTKFFCVGITTNGTLPLETSADTVWVSLDGLATTHNLNRGDNFDPIIANIQQSTHPHILVNVTINQLNFQEIPDLVRFLKGKVKGITFQFYYPFPDSEDLWLPEENRIKILDELIHLKKAGYPILNSTRVLNHLKKNTWNCHPWLIGSVEPDGRISYGCYLRNRAEIACDKCGFAAHAELSLAYDAHLPAILIGRKAFKFRWF
jgi:MoaA/NifB/PqqE/SkfB family radical SAM enzyme